MENSQSAPYSHKETITNEQNLYCLLSDSDANLQVFTDEQSRHCFAVISLFAPLGKETILTVRQSKMCAVRIQIVCWLRAFKAVTWVSHIKTWQPICCSLTSYSGEFKIYARSVMCPILVLYFTNKVEQKHLSELYVFKISMIIVQYILHLKEISCFIFNQNYIIAKYT